MTDPAGQHSLAPPAERYEAWLACSSTRRKALLEVDGDSPGEGEENVTQPDEVEEPGEAGVELCDDIRVAVAALDDVVLVGLIVTVVGEPEGMDHRRRPGCGARVLPTYYVEHEDDQKTEWQVGCSYTA
jgi:hypothetical protein